MENFEQRMFNYCTYKPRAISFKSNEIVDVNAQELDRWTHISITTELFDFCKNSETM